MLSEYSPKVNLTVENTLAGDGSEENISLTFRDIKDFTPEEVARQIPTEGHARHAQFASRFESESAG